MYAHTTFSLKKIKMSLLLHLIFCLVDSADTLQIQTKSKRSDGIKMGERNQFDGFISTIPGFYFSSHLGLLLKDSLIVSGYFVYFISLVTEITKKYLRSNDNNTERF